MSAKKYYYFMGDDTEVAPIGLVCGDTVSETYEGTAYYPYPSKIVNINAGTVSIGWDVFDRPNRFTIYRNGVLLTTSGWQGAASYPGPWGASLAGDSSGSFSYTAEAGYTYTILVEVGNASNVPEDVISDSYSFTISCS